MTIDWNKLRPWNGSQASGFEELCCQLAYSESPPAGSRFIRKGTPDAGVECFWRLPNGEEWAWQAKFFRSALSTTQWSQIDESVQNAIEKHPNLVKYTICLPIDRSDARVGKQKSFSMKWDDRVKKWEGLASTKGMSVSFEYWGQSEIGLRLSEEKHRGRHWFWFNKESFSNEWFVQRVEEAVANAGDRYTPKLHVEIPIIAYFDALGRTPTFFAWLENLYSKARIKYKRIRPIDETNSSQEDYQRVVDAAHNLFSKIEPWIKCENHDCEWAVTQPISWNSIRNLADDLIQTVNQCISKLWELKNSHEKGENKFSDLQYNLDSLLHNHLEFRYAISEITEDINAEKGQLLDRPAFLLSGAAGQGKTHLLCEIAKRETKENRPRLLFHGGHFRNNEPWSQMIRLLGLNCSRDEFIGALEAAAQVNCCRIIIFIDALNEGDGNRLWQKFLLGMLTALENSRWLGICLSIRSGYEDLIIPESLDESQILRLTHHGFAEVEDQAASIYFSHYRIEPSAPLLLPEFENPLFLKLLCQGLNNEGMTRIPLGLHGITKIFSFFTDSIDEKLSRPEYLNYDVRERFAGQAIDRLADAMARGQTDYLPLADGKKIVNELLPRDGFHNSLFRHLESEGILSITPRYSNTEGMGWTERIHFTYQWFSDHQIAKQLLNQYFDRDKPKKSFSKCSVLGKLFIDENACWRYRGFLEALLIQVPELTGKEFPEIAPNIAKFFDIREAFVGSIAWRDVNSFSSATNSYINKEILAYNGTAELFWDTMIVLSTIPNHPFNADRLHKILEPLDMAHRDAWWSTFLHKNWQEEKSSYRLVHWAWEENDKSKFDDEVIRLAAITLMWFFTSSNRFLRDQATKAMVRLCEKRIQALRQVVEKFSHVNDPYVLERLYAAAYGCAMRTTDNQSLGELAQDVYRFVFEPGAPPPHILLRDYARGVIETALYRGSNLDIEVSKIRPPYRSDWPSIEVPELNILKQWGKWKDGLKNGDRSKCHLYDSVMNETMADFSCYVVGELDEWFSERINEPHQPTHEELYDQFVETLTKRQKEALESLKVCRLIRQLRDARSRLEPNKNKVKAEDDAELHSAEQCFIRTLRKNSRKYRLFLDIVSPYIVEPSKYFRENSFDGQYARRWLMKKIIDMGWTVKRFGNFDRDINDVYNRGRGEHKPERIGKKYQWIAYHELLARLSDNFKLRIDTFSNHSDIYQGPWDLGFRRDIDPSNLLKVTQGNKRWDRHSDSWWIQTKFDSWEEPEDEIAWLKKKDNLPCVEKLIEVTQHQNNERWLTLNGFYHWEQPTPPGEEQFENSRRELRYMLKCYLVRKKDVKTLSQWAKKQNWMGRWMPESDVTHNAFFGEFFWGFIFHNEKRQEWSRGDFDKVPVDLLVANNKYCKESGFDCSIDDSININLPCRFLLEEMKLEWRGIEGKWYDSQGKLVAYDPSVIDKGPEALLFHRDSLLDFLSKNDLTLFWTILGEKQTIGGVRMPENYKGRLEIYGAYFLDKDKISGKTTSKFNPPPK